MTGAKNMLKNFFDTVGCFLSDCFWVIVSVGLMCQAPSLERHSVYPLMSFFLGVFILWLVIGNNTIVRRYDKYFKGKIVNSPFIDMMVIGFGVPLSNRTLIRCRTYRLTKFYFTPLIHPKLFLRNPILKSVFEGVDFQAHVTIFERIYAYFMVFICIVLLALIFIHVLQVVMN